MMRVSILEILVDAQTFDEALDTLTAWAEQPQKRYVSTCPVYTLMVARENPRMRRALERADMVTADGMPLVWLQRQIGYPGAERVYGPDMMRALCEKTANQEIRHFFWGGLPGVAEQLAQQLQRAYPGLQIAGTYSPPVEEIGDTPNPTVVGYLNSARAHIIWVGLGSPKQDLWMTLYRPFLDAPLLIGVGAAFDFVAGTKPQAPRWMQRSGLEWLFRLSREPGRLWRRYLIYNSRFLWSVFRHHGVRR
jgi:N-acetylglucosaminyldiphosphoundecaprenol N-acetyl-beta-D-mannosaminyltransferase